MLDSRLRMAFDLLEDGEVVHVSGPEEATIFGTTAKLGQLMKDDKYKEALEKLDRYLQSNYSNNDRIELSGTVRELGRMIFASLINADQHIGEIYNTYIGRAGRRPQDLSISFRVDTQHLGFHLEFMRDLSNIPVAAKFPLFKTLARKELSARRKDLNPKEKLKVLLISSNTELTPEQDIKIGNDEESLGIALRSVPELDNPNNEIDSIDSILGQSQVNDEKNVEAKVIHTNEIDSSTFFTTLESEEFDIIHYNGHGYFNADNPERSFICFWESKNMQGKVVAVTTNELYSVLKHKQKQLKLFYLSCCEGSGVAPRHKILSNNFLGLIEPIIDAGVPNVIAMHWPIPVNNAKALSAYFYSALFLSDYNTVESAMTIAREQSLHFSDPAAWCSPTLVKRDC